MEEFIGKYVIIRGNHSGVFAGTLVEKDGSTVVLKDTRRLWYWSGANSISQIALEGVKDKDKDECKFTVTVENIAICDVIEIIQCTKEAKENIMSVEVWKR